MADVHSYTDYYPYGMPMPGRSRLDNDYRYGFNGMETDPEAKSGWGNQNTTFFRQYDARLGRWMSIDPVTHAFQSPYNALMGIRYFGLILVVLMVMDQEIKRRKRKPNHQKNMSWEI